MRVDQFKPFIIIDSNAWDFLQVSNIDLDSSLLEPYDFAITIEILREMEMLSVREDKAHLYEYFKRQMTIMGEEKIDFGFFDSEFGDDEQTGDGFGSSVFPSEKERIFIESRSHMIKASKRAFYYGNQADLLIASRAGGNCYILTEDNCKSGPMKGLGNTVFVSRERPMTIIEFKQYLECHIPQYSQ